ncbi:MAG: hypothetical protein A2Z17_01960 [Gammaproteobacteria bacterium RBG_16_66_13]|nr:MAG: hypothetical protein A2Z17_01960 [Gammaproteobacteria bacterium RBG_16_66_13]
MRNRAAAAVITSPDNVFYLSHSYIATQRVIRERVAAVIVYPDAPPSMVVCDVEEAFARVTSTIEDVRAYVEFAQSPVEVIAEALRSRGVDRERVLVELDHLTSKEVSGLQARLPQVALEDAGHLVEHLRAVKRESEVETLRHGAMATSRALLGALSLAQLGDPSRSILELVSYGLMHLGADRVAFLGYGQDAPGKAGTLYGGPEGQTLSPGTVLRVDCSGVFGGYFSDLARMAAVAPVPSAVFETYTHLIDVRDAIVRMIHPGVPISALYDTCREEFRRRGLPFTMPHIGHSLGIGYHEHPVIQPQASDVVQEGMVLAIEPITVIPGLGGFHVEDTVHVTLEGAEILSVGGDTLTVIR